MYFERGMQVKIKDGLKDYVTGYQYAGRVGTVVDVEIDEAYASFFVRFADGAVYGFCRTYLMPA